MTTTIEHLNPDGLSRNPGFTQAVAVTGPHKVVYVGGQDGVDAAGRVVGADMRTQTQQIWCVAGLARPELLIELDAVAVVPL